MASLFVIQGADQGKRFDLNVKPLALGREASNPIRLHDHEVSRRHAEVQPFEDSYRIVDLGSANGTYLNGRPVDQAPLRPGDRLRLGQTVMLFSEGAAGAQRDLTGRVDLLADDRSAIIKSIPADLMTPPGEAAGEWLQVRLSNLAVLYEATRAISHVVDTDALLPQILQLVFDAIGADRGAILLRDESGTLEPKAVRWRGSSDPGERMAISRTITDHVLGRGEGVITTDAPTDARFSAGQSIVSSGVREAICVPIQGRHGTPGVLYADTRSLSALDAADPTRANRSRFTQEHLSMMVAIGHQAGLAIENSDFYRAKLEAERLAAVGQTIATLSHHIKNILQGIRGGSYLIDMGLNEKDEVIVRRGWTIVEKNQNKIYNLVMDMLSFSKEREPALETADLNQAVADVVELMQSRADELGVALAWEPDAEMPPVLIDTEGIHRAVLNIVTNAIDAAEDRPEARVAVATSWDAESSTARVSVADNGPGIAEDDLGSIFQVFASTKGARGTGLGLPVSQKVVREHGGRIAVDSRPGRGTTFTIELPSRKPDGQESGERATIP